MNLTLVRHSYGKQCTLGYLFVGGHTFATLEEGWRPDPDGPGGQRRETGLKESCVPDGLYSLVPHNTPKHPNTWALVNHALGIYQQPGDIPAGQKYGRSAILIHSGNTVADTEGCILVGARHGWVDGQDAVLESRNALLQLRDALGPISHTLEIRPTAGTSEVVP